MAVYVQKPGKDVTKLEDDEVVMHAYQVTDGGVLRVLMSEKDQGKWSVIREYSPAAWLEASGKRYTQDTSALGGFLGGAVETKSVYENDTLTIV